jgi:hypothetical protein
MTRRWRRRALNFIFLRNTRITGTGLECLYVLRNVLWLDLAGVQCLDPLAMLTIGASRSLIILNLERTNVSDAWLPSMKGLLRLDWLGLIGTKVTRHAVWDLRQWLPRATIVHNEGIDFGSAATEKN